MMTEPCIDGKIKVVRQQQVVLQFADDKTCAGCGIKHLCNEKQITLDRHLFDDDIKPGQNVQVVYHKVFQTAVIIYLLPLFFFFGGLFLGRRIWGPANEPMQIFMAFIGLVLGLLVLNRLNKILSGKKYKIEVKTIGR